MNIYQVIMTPDAIDDITALGNYIADVLGGVGQPKDIIRKYFLEDFYTEPCAEMENITKEVFLGQEKG